LNDPETQDVASALRAGGALLGDGGRFEAELLLGAVLGLDRAGLVRERDRRLSPAETDRYATLVAARRTGRPIAHLLGRREFRSLDFLVDERVLVPRPETELLVELALELLPDSPPGPIVDLGTGSGAVAVALALECPGRAVFAVDLSAGALAVARRNVARLAPDRVSLVRADWLNAFADDCAALVVSNPPYVEDDYPDLATAALGHEPRGALAAGPEGMDALRTLVPAARRCLCSGGWLAVEHGAGQGPAVRALLAAAGFEAVTTRVDLAGLERTSAGRKPHRVGIAP